MRYARGRSLLELLVAVAIAAVLSTIGLPALSAVLTDSRRVITVNALIASIQLARSEAAKRGAAVTLCASRDGERCAGADWQSGWIVFVNADDDMPARVDSGETVLKVGAPAPRVRLAANRAAFTLRPFGARSTNGTFTVCPADDTDAARTVIVSPIGRPRVSRRMPNGEPPRCQATR